MRKTKIICTLGPATDKGNVMKELMLSGVDVVRFNFSHQTHEEHKTRYEKVVKIREELNFPIATLMDTKGPEIRLHLFEGGKTKIKEGNTFTLYTKEILGNSEQASITYADFYKDITVGTRILIDDGLIELKVTSATQEKIETIVVCGGTLKDRKSCNVPGVTLSIPYISEQDIEDITFAARLGFDFIAASFVRSKEDINQIRSLLHRLGADDIRIIAKIENAEGVENIDEILHIADGIMIARGDMGVEIPFEQLPAIQKKLIKNAYLAGKMVITATQMLESMIHSPRPTRAEASDIANAIYDGTSAIMLSGETAAGEYPVIALQTMDKIARKAEGDIDYEKRFKNRDTDDNPNVTNAISEATVTTAHTMHAGAIICVSKSGLTARMISKFRPSVPIVCCAMTEKVWRQLSLSWGVIPLKAEEKKSTDELFDHSVDVAVEAGIVGKGDLVVITAGIPLGVSGTTNMLKVHVVGNILVTGSGINDMSVVANLCVSSTEEEALEQFNSGDILVVPQTSNALMPLLREAAGIITEIPGSDTHAAIVGMSLNIPVIVGASNATNMLHSGVTVALDAKRGIVTGN